MKNKYVCPRCGGQLHFWKTIATCTEQMIDKETGERGKETQREMYSLDEEGLECKECDWIFNWISYTGDDMPIEFERKFEKLSEQWSKQGK